MVSPLRQSTTPMYHARKPVTTTQSLKFADRQPTTTESSLVIHYLPINAVPSKTHNKKPNKPHGGSSYDKYKPVKDSTTFKTTYPEATSIKPSGMAKGKILDFYKERVQQYYDGHVEEIGFNIIGDVLRRRTNLLVKRQTMGKVPEYLRGSTLSLKPPLAAFTANIFQTECERASTEGRDGEMYFVVRPSTRQRRLVPVPAAVWRTGFTAGYEPGLDATAVSLNHGSDNTISSVYVLPGQQGQVAPGDGLARLEQRLIETSYRRGGWSRLLRSLLKRPGLELQLPRFSHRSVLNVTATLQRMGLKDVFSSEKADLRGLNGIPNDLHLSDIIQGGQDKIEGEHRSGLTHNHICPRLCSPTFLSLALQRVTPVLSRFRVFKTTFPEEDRLEFSIQSCDQLT
ncbi:leukocyte elastase inhibitor A-like [Diaphorina citri]|uniref:Leukocyte elastase inhibitor A-like n=1 Tax=Diaphorina citri TaxID=121845 RepID=A0A1S3DT78_DIACI|nr:leukocyte elastase inhibitor A-like [Diaphorina citri]